MGNDSQTAFGRYGRAALGVVLLLGIICGGLYARTSVYRRQFEAGRDMVFAGEARSGRRILTDYLGARPQGAHAADCHYYIGKSYLLENNREQARATFLYVKEAFPDSPPAQQASYDIAMLDLWRGEEKRALAAFRAIAEARIGPCVPEATAMAQWLERRNPQSAVAENDPDPDASGAPQRRQ